MYNEETRRPIISTAEELKRMGFKEVLDGKALINKDAIVCIVYKDGTARELPKRKIKNYWSIGISRANYYVHKLYADAFLPEYTGKNKRVVFRDGNTDNISESNLIIVSQKELTKMERLAVTMTKEELEENGFVAVDKGRVYINKDGEIWKTHPDIPNSYFKQKKYRKATPAAIYVCDEKGHLRELSVAKLYAEAFIPNEHGYKYLAYKDEDNHALETLMWVEKRRTPKKTKERRMEELRQKYAGAENIELSDKHRDILEMRLQDKALSEIADKYNCSRQNVHLCLKSIEEKCIKYRAEKEGNT